MVEHVTFSLYLERYFVSALALMMHNDCLESAFREVQVCQAVLRINRFPILPLDANGNVVTKTQPRRRSWPNAKGTAPKETGPQTQTGQPTKKRERGSKRGRPQENETRDTKRNRVQTNDITDSKETAPEKTRPLPKKRDRHSLHRLRCEKGNFLSFTFKWVSFMMASRMALTMTHEHEAALATSTMLAHIFQNHAKTILT